jgi:methylglyoxal synthase
MNQLIEHLDQSEGLNFVMERTKHIALIAHDAKKQALIEWAQANQGVLARHFLCGTGTTARLIADKTGLPITAYNSGPLGGDQQIGCRIVEGLIDFVIFLWDPLESQPHDPDVKALLRIAVLYDIPIANNLATADFLLASRLMDEHYSRKVESFRNIRI